MIRFNLNARVIFYFWVAINCVILIYSGYFQLLGLAFLKSDFKAFIEIHTKFYPFDTLDIKYFDLSEFFFYIFVPVFLFNWFRKLFPKRRKFDYIQNPY
jgi:hypothetical protein